MSATGVTGAGEPAGGPGQRSQEEGSPRPSPAREPRPAGRPNDGPTDARIVVRRLPERADYQRESAYAILDEGLVAHVGFEVDGQPLVIPMAYGRDGDRLLLHGSVASRLQRRLASGLPACVTVTLLDALVLARSQFHHSMNYRSVVVLGTATRIRDEEASRRALERIVEHIVPGRSAEARGASAGELRLTSVLEMPIEAVSVKARTGGPVDDEADLASGVWAGLVPVSTTFGAPARDGAVGSDPGLPPSLSPYGRPIADGR